MPSDLIKIENSFFDAVLCLNGDLPDKQIFENLGSAKLVVADGAGNTILEIGIEPEVIIGDLDSLKNKHKQNELLNLVEIEDQDSNDFEKCLKWCEESGFEDILIFGFNGGDLEHTLNNWSVFKKFSRRLNLTILDKGRYGFSLYKDSEISLQAGELISLIPQTQVRLRTKGLKWELDNEILELGLREGARNVALSNNVELEILEGELLLFCDSRLPYRFNLKNY